MAVTPLKGMRIWVAFVTFVSLAVTIAFYSYIDFYARKSKREGTFDESRWDPFLWQDYVSVIAPVVLFLIYLSSLFVNRRLVPSKFLRAFLILVPTAFLLYVHANNIASNIRLQNEVNARVHSTAGPDFKFAEYNWLVCERLSWTLCYLEKSKVFLGIITGFFVVVEVVMSLVMSPPAKTVDF